VTRQPVRGPQRALGIAGERRAARLLRAAVLGGAVLACLLPLAWTALASFRVVPDNTQSPPKWTPPLLDSYTGEIGIAEPAFVQELSTSAALSLAATLLTVTLSFLAAYSLARSRFRGKRLLVQGSLILASLPVMTYIIPLSESMRRAHLEDTFIGLLLAQTAVLAPLAVYVLHGYLAQLSIELEEAATLEGASAWQVLGAVVLPVAAPGVAATALILFVLSWNQFLVPLVLTTSQVKTIPVAMSDFFTFERELEWPTAAAALMVSLLPLAVLVTVAYRALERFRLAPVD
jgi:ABC-type glycerol-3-phosphate transport system permease component